MRKSSIESRHLENWLACKKKFLRFFRNGFKDPKYVAWERGYKWKAHEIWNEMLNKETYKNLLKQKKYEEIAQTAVKIESRTNLLFSFEKMALRDAIRSRAGAKEFATGLFDYLYGTRSLKTRFEKFSRMISALPRKQTRVLTWPLVTVFGFIAKPEEHIFMKPKVTKAAARNYDFDLHYSSKPNWETYQNLLAFAKRIYKDVKDLRPKDFIDLQSYIWVIGSEEYSE